MLLVEGLTEVCRQVLVLAGLSLFLEVLLPGGNLKKYTQFVMGLLLVAALLNPLLGLTRGLAPEVKASVFSDMQQILSGQADTTEQIVTAGSNLADGVRAQAAQELASGQEQAENIGRAVRQTVADFYDIEPAAVQVSIANYQSSNLAAENIKAE